MHAQIQDGFAKMVQFLGESPSQFSWDDMSDVAQGIFVAAEQVDLKLHTRE